MLVCVNAYKFHIYGTIFIIVLRQEVFGKHTHTQKKSPTKTTLHKNTTTKQGNTCAASMIKEWNLEVISVST